MLYEPQLVVFRRPLVVPEAQGFVIQRGKVRQFCSALAEATVMFEHAVRDLKKFTHNQD